MFNNGEEQDSHEPGRIRALVAAAEHSSRRVLAEMLRDMPELKVAGVIHQEEQVVARTRLSAPDLLLLHTGFLAGKGAKEMVAELKKVPGVQVVAWTEDAQSPTLSIAQHLLQDVLVVPPTGGEGSNGPYSSLIRLLRRLCKPRGGAVQQAEPVKAAPSVPRRKQRPQAVLIGASTGGPVALTTVLGMLPADFPLPIAIVQHMPAMFTSLLAQRLDGICPLPVREGSSGTPLAPGSVVLGPGGYHMRLVGTSGHCSVQLDCEPPENSCRPAVDVLFRSAASVFGGSVLTVVLTGMGKDGLLGAEHLRALGSHVIVQDAATSTVWGMPGAIARAGFADAVLPLTEIVPELMRCL